MFVQSMKNYKCISPKKWLLYS